MAGRDRLPGKLHAWRMHKTAWHAADFLGAAFVLGRTGEALEAAHFILASGTNAPQPVKQLAEQVLTGSSQPPTCAAAETLSGIRARLHDARIRLREDPRNAVLLVDVARDYAILGSLRQATHAMAMALALAPENRFVLRCAVRLYQHSGDLERAHDLIARARAAPGDPWLLAAEMAVASAAHRKPRFTKRARQTLAGGSHPPAHLSEMASALATLELAAGKTRAAKRLFGVALRAPNDNTLAQAEWAASGELRGWDVDLNRFVVPCNFEALASRDFYAGQWDASLGQALGWLHDQGFSTRPAAHASYLASSIFEDYPKAQEILECGLRANPTEPTLLNNLAYALAMSGRPLEALDVLRRVDRSAPSGIGAVPLIATWGLIQYKLGNPKEGRALYAQAIEKAKGNRRYRAAAAINLAREEILLRSPVADQALKEAVQESARVHEPDIAFLLMRVVRLAGLPTTERPRR